MEPRLDSRSPGPYGHHTQLEHYFERRTWCGKMVFCVGLVETELINCRFTVGHTVAKCQQRPSPLALLPSPADWTQGL